MHQGSSQPQCLFSSRIERQGESYVIEVPASEIELGTLSTDELYQVGVFSHPARSPDPAPESPADRSRTASPGPADHQAGRGHQADPPVEEGDRRAVTIEGVGEEGDGIAKVDRGYVLIVPDTEPGEQVEVEVTKATENVGFAEVVGPGGP